MADMRIATPRSPLALWQNGLVHGLVAQGGEPEPECDFDPTAVEFHRWAEEERRKILYHGTDWQTHRT